MQIKIKLFAILKDMLGREELLLDFAEGDSCKDILSRLQTRCADLAPVLRHSMIAVNGCYANLGTVLSAEDEIAILPPVSGG
jgi:molybdopterin converting factor small subunit